MEHTSKNQSWTDRLIYQSFIHLMEKFVKLVETFIATYPILRIGWNRTCNFCHLEDKDMEGGYETCDKCAFAVCARKDLCHLQHPDVAKAHDQRCKQFGIGNFNNLILSLFDAFKREKEKSSLFNAALVETAVMLYTKQSKDLNISPDLVKLFFTKDASAAFANSSVRLPKVSPELTNGVYTMARLKELSPTSSDTGVMALLFATMVYDAWAYAPVSGVLIGFFNTQARNRLYMAQTIVASTPEKPVYSRVSHECGRTADSDPDELLPWYAFEVTDIPLCQVFLMHYGTPLDAATLKPVNVLYHIDLIHLDKTEATAFASSHRWAPNPIKPATPPPRYASTSLLVRLMGTFDTAIVQVVQQHSTLYTVHDWISGKLYSRKEEDQVSRMRMMNHPEPEFSLAAVKTTAEITLQRVTHLVRTPDLARRDFQTGGINSIVRLGNLIDTLALSDNPQNRQEAYTELTGVKWKGPLNKFHVAIFQANLVG